MKLFTLEFERNVNTVSFNQESVRKETRNIKRLQFICWTVEEERFKKQESRNWFGSVDRASAADSRVQVRFRGENCKVYTFSKSETLFAWGNGEKINITNVTNKGLQCSPPYNFMM
ncbi:hypothetical protein QTO34_004552 [Cnephaeus nilssonii]|uniref:Uncharacterized protein n=1 Tax=Cnephaeus nilssonii TaxID=3371016 RepID=A0AA40HQG1_CNENI|nr:hypothetical protein QTO34_004552 [Eptesicus nilssonii]